MERVKIEYPGIDIAKFIMAILVVAIHVEPFDGELAFLYNHCIARIADPLFFIITAFFMFDKAFDMDFSWECLRKYMIRIVKLYFSWIIIYSPIIVFRTWNETLDFKSCCILLIKKIFLSGPYGAMWFLTALLLAIPLTYIVTKYTKPWFCVVVSAPFFIVTVLQMEYYKWVVDIELFQKIIKGFENVFGWLANGLNYGFFFCSLGMYIAYMKHKNKNYSFVRNSIFALLFFWILVCECYFIRINQTGLSYGAMFFLIPTSWFMCISLLSVKVNTNTKYSWLRKSSILIFTIHYGVMDTLQYILEKIDYLSIDRTCLYVFVLIITMLIAILILKISQYKCFRWMRNLY